MRGDQKKQPRLRLVQSTRAGGGFRSTISNALIAAAEYLSGVHVVEQLPNVLSADREFTDALLRAGKIQNLGYPIKFSFLSRFPDSPHLYMCAGGSDEDYQASGFDYCSRADAFVKVLGETVERALWKNGLYWNTASIRGTPHTLGSRAIDITSLAGFSKAQRANDPHLAFTAHTEFLWTPGLRLSDKASVLVPAQLMSARYAQEAQPTEPLLRQPTTNGIATYTSFDDAAYRGLLELIERDAFMITFHNRISAPRIDPHTISSDRIRSVLDSYARFRLSCETILLPTDMPTTVVLCILRDESGIGPALAVGAKAHHDPEVALLGAMTEAHATWHFVRRQDAYRAPLPPTPWKQTECLAFWGKSENAGKLSWMWQGPLVAMPDGSENARTLIDLAHAAEKNGCMSAAVSMSPPELENLGFFSVHVISPELQPLSLGSDIAYAGGTRLKTVPKKLGYSCTDNPPPYPHPFP